MALRMELESPAHKASTFSSLLFDLISFSDLIVSSLCSFFTFCFYFVVGPYSPMLKGNSWLLSGITVAGLG